MHEFAPALEAVGELEAYFSMAKLMNEHNDKYGAQFCFVEYINQSTPYVRLEHAWNPFIDRRTAVANTVELGAPSKELAILLGGSNENGKSTLLKSILLSILLAHTFGVACAKRAIMTPFHYIGASGNIVDNIDKNQSKFRAAIDNLVDIINASEYAHDQGKRSFIVLDEPLDGTDKDDTDMILSKAALQLCAHSTTCFILATHYKQVAQLAKDPNNRCANFKMDAHIDPHTKNITRPFKLERGIGSALMGQAIFEQALATRRIR